MRDSRGIGIINLAKTEEGTITRHAGVEAVPVVSNASATPAAPEGHVGGRRSEDHFKHRRRGEQEQENGYRQMGR
jgi:hypothetical protein